MAACDTRRFLWALRAEANSKLRRSTRTPGKITISADPKIAPWVLLETGFCGNGKTTLIIFFPKVFSGRAFIAAGTYLMRDMVKN
jgi:hypothetical protein